MPVPEAPVDLHHDAMSRQHQIWFAGQVFGVQPVAKSRRM